MSWYVYRDSRTGEFITAAEAKARPDTTERQQVNPREHSSRVIAQYAVHEDDAPGVAQMLADEAEASEAARDTDVALVRNRPRKRAETPEPEQPA